jgi:alkanesulfonate monooxygenase SsuD/methylene tetrahydromethanopterin reductase-like flavin-dependent oxidoreductase (luciferase family)
MLQALAIYRETFRPSAQLDKPYAMLGLNICAADSDAEAARLFTSLQQQWTLLRRGSPAALPPPVDTMDGLWSDMERAGLENALGRAIVGSAETVAGKLKAFIAETAADEIVMTSQVFDHQARLRSFEIVAQIRDQALGA